MLVPPVILISPPLWVAQPMNLFSWVLLEANPLDLPLPCHRHHPTTMAADDCHPRSPVATDLPPLIAESPSNNRRPAARENSHLEF